MSWFGAVQAQDYPGSLWAIGLRLPGPTQVDVEQAIADRSLIRTWPMRGTLHFVPPEDAGWMLELLTPRVIASTASRYRELGLDEKVFAHAQDVLLVALEGGNRLTRKAAMDALRQAGIEADGQRGPHILGYLAQRGVLCFGPREGKQFTVVLLDEWVSRPRKLGHHEALAELARRYFRSHGPATAHDFAWWSGLTMADARASIESAGTALSSDEIGGVRYWAVSAATAKTGPQHHAWLLPPFDEYLVAYRDRSAALDPLRAAGPTNPIDLLSPTIVINGRVVGTWKRKMDKDALTIEGRSYGSLAGREIEAVEQAAGRYGDFLGVPAKVKIQVA